MIADINEEGAREATAALGGSEGLALRVDVSDQASVAATIEAILARHGRLDILVNNAGTNRPARFQDVAPEDFDAVLDLNLRGCFFAA